MGIFADSCVHFLLISFDSKLTVRNQDGSSFLVAVSSLVALECP
jgi:hypothetical protein